MLRNKLSIRWRRAKLSMRTSLMRIERFLPKKRTTLMLIVLLALVLSLAIAGAILHFTRTALHQAFAQPPQVGTVVLAPADSKAQHALNDQMPMDDSARSATEHLAAQPTAYWLTPEQNPLGSAGAMVTNLAAQARKQNVALAIVIYGLPERDCGNHSAGGLPTGQYLEWIGEISAALKISPDLKKIVVLEPDSLALAPSCGNLEERATQLRAAVNVLQGPATWIYLDGGHSSWLPADQMAELISSVGVNDRIRGFATNVSNYRSSSDEFAYAEAVSAKLGGLHAIIDTSRNGVATAGSAWCNPPGQQIGEPGGTYGNDVVDTNLWIKPPGESDGPCNGGPAPGVWWPEGAHALVQGLP